MFGSRSHFISHSYVGRLAQRYCCCYSCCIVVVVVGVWQGVVRIDRCLTVQSYCRERAGLDFDLLGYPSRPAALAQPLPHVVTISIIITIKYPYDQHRESQHDVQQPYHCHSDHHQHYHYNMQVLWFKPFSIEPCCIHHVATIMCAGKRLRRHWRRD